MSVLRIANPLVPGSSPGGPTNENNGDVKASPFVVLLPLAGREMHLISSQAGRSRNHVIVREYDLRC